MRALRGEPTTEAPSNSLGPIFTQGRSSADVNFAKIRKLVMQGLPNCEANCVAPPPDNRAGMGIRGEPWAHALRSPDLMMK